MSIGIVADDMTGALDAAAPFADPARPFTVAWHPPRPELPFAISTNSRDMAPDEAAKRARDGLAGLQAARDGIDARISETADPAVWPSVSVVSVGEPSAPVPVGAVSAEAGRIAYESIARAVDEAMQRRLAAVVTAPISKEALHLAGYPYNGHTEMLGHLSGSRDTCMMLAHETLRVAHMSTHTALARVPDMVTPERLDRVLTLTIDALPQLGIAEPRIAVAALNPHAGEGGLFGREDIDITQPVVERYRANGLAVSGPIAGDTVFVRAVAGEFDAVIAMYHDQGHVPVKLLGFRVDPASGRWLGLRGVNITLGLPFIRTSVDHGTAFDIAAQGIASAQSMVEAIDMAVKLSRQTHAAGPQTARRASDMTHRQRAAR